MTLAKNRKEPQNASFWKRWLELSMELRIWRSFRLWWNGERVRRMIIYAIWADVGRLWFHEQTTSCMDLWDLSIHMYIYIYHIVDNYMLWYHIYIHSIKFTYNYIICILYDVLQTIIYRLYIYNYIHSIYCKYTSCLSNSSVKNMQPSGSPNWFPETIFKGPTWINTTEFTH